MSSLFSKKGVGCGDKSSILAVKMEEKDVPSPCRQTSEVVEPPLKVQCLDPPAKKELNKNVDAKLEELTLKADTLSSQVIKLIGVCREHNEITGTKSAPNLDSALIPGDLMK